MAGRRGGYGRCAGGLSTRRGVNATADALGATLEYAWLADVDVAARAEADHVIAAAVEQRYDSGSRRSTPDVIPTPYERQLGGDADASGSGSICGSDRE